MARVTNLVRHKQNENSAYQRDLKSLEQNREMVEVPFEWQIKQTDKAVFFQTYGWIPIVCIRFRKPNGKVVPWSAGHEGDAFLIAKEFVK